MSNYFKESFKKKKTKADKDNLIDNLYKIPKKEKGVNMPHFQELEDNIIQQADLLFLPEDKGYKYALVVVDTGTSITDAEPVKSKEQKEILKAFQKIYERDIIDIPKIMQVDAGTEFKGIVAQYFKDNKCAIRVAKAGRHRAQGKVERKNQLIGTALFKRMASEEAITGEESKEWVADLPLLIEAMNDKIEEFNESRNKKTKIPEKVLCEGNTCTLLTIGTKVRTALDNPIGNIKGERLFGKFRSTDIRYNTEPRTIENIILKPKSPPLYQLNPIEGDEHTPYTKEQLQVVSKNEKAPNPEQVLRNKKPSTYVVEKVIGKKKIKNKWMMQIKWKGYSIADSTFEPRAELMKNPAIKALIEEYEADN